MAEKRLTPVARRLRRDSTDVEALLWSRLRGSQLGAKFVRQFPVGAYVVDFACRSLKLVVELDGGQHDRQREADEVRTRAIEVSGYRVIRFWNNEVSENLEGVLARICAELELARAG